MTYWKVLGSLRLEIYEAPATSRNPPSLDHGNNRLKRKTAFVFPTSGAGRGAGLPQVGSQRYVWNTDKRSNSLKAGIQNEVIRKPVGQVLFECLGQ